MILKLKILRDIKELVKQKSQRIFFISINYSDIYLYLHMVHTYADTYIWYSWIAPPFTIIQDLFFFFRSNDCLSQAKTFNVCTPPALNLCNCQNFYFVQEACATILSICEYIYLYIYIYMRISLCKCISILYTLAHAQRGI